MKKKLGLLLILGLVAVIFVACTGGDTAKNKNDVVTLKWVMVGNGMAGNYDEWKDNINEYLEEKIGVNIEVEVVSWGDWENRRNIIINSGEKFDILFTDMSRYISEVELGAFYDITELVKENASKLYEYIPEDYWNAVRVDGKIYSVPTYKDSSMTQYFVWDKELADKYNINYNEYTTLASLTEPLRKLKEGEGSAPFILDKLGLSAILSQYDNMGAELEALGVRIDDKTRTVVNVLKQEDVFNDLKKLHEWYKEGLINPDAATLAEVPTYRPIYVAQGWSSAAKTTWGPNMGVEAVAVEYMSPTVSNSTVRGSLNAIYSGSEHPEKALEFLQLVNLDSYVRDAFYYGLEGDNFKYTEDGKVEKLNSEWTMAGYTQATFFTVSQLKGEKINQWEEVKELNAKATPSVLLGFDLDSSKIQNKLANCREVFMRYRSELLTGSRDPEELVDIITNELEAAGFNEIVEEAQNQIDAAFNQ